MVISLGDASRGAKNRSWDIGVYDTVFDYPLKSHHFALQFSHAPHELSSTPQYPPKSLCWQ